LSSNNPNHLPLQISTHTDLTKSPLIPLGMYMYFIIYSPISITPPSTILNKPINSFYPPDTAPVLNSYNISLSLFHPSPPSSSFRSFLWWPLLKTLTYHLYCVFTYILPLLIDKDLCKCRKILSFSVCSFSASFIGRHLHFFGKNHPLYSYFYTCFSL